MFSNIVEKTKNIFKFSQQDNNGKMKPEPNRNNQGQTKRPMPKRRNIIIWVLIAILVGFILFNIFAPRADVLEMTRSRFETLFQRVINEPSLAKSIESFTARSIQGNSVVVSQFSLIGLKINGNQLVAEKGNRLLIQVITDNANWHGTPGNTGFYLFVEGLRSNLITQIGSNKVDVIYGLPAQPSFFQQLLVSIIPILIFVGILMFFSRRMMQNQQGGAFSMGQSKARMIVSNLTFDKVAGYDEIKEELVEVVDYLKYPMKYKQAGARIPKGVLLSGPPGTGKTLFAKAVAGEARVPFFSISGSDFVEMFVGVGASRVRSMFKTAKQNSPCIIFIDELDAVGRHRGAGVGGGNDEREQTLNQLLVEMDGFDTAAGIVVMAATNRPDVLDPAIKRPGRFDRDVQLRLPDVLEREAILKVHALNKKVDPSLSFKDLAKRTPGFSGAQLENIINESSILMVRLGKPYIDLEIVDEAVDRVMAGPAKPNKIISEEEKKQIAYHEAGHAVVGLVLEHASEVQKITIIPRGDAGGYVLMTPKVEKMISTKAELKATIVSYLAGRVAEQEFFGADNISTGAYADIQSSTTIARQMVTEYGMSRLGPIQYEQRENVFLGRQLSENKRFSSETAHQIDEEVNSIINDCSKIAHETIKKHKKLLTHIAETLIHNETIIAEEIRKIYDDYVNGKELVLTKKPRLTKKVISKNVNTTSSNNNQTNNDQNSSNSSSSKSPSSARPKTLLEKRKEELEKKNK